MFDPENQREVVRLHDAVEWSYGALEYARNYVDDAVRAYVGMHYGADAFALGREPVPAPLMEMFVDVVTRDLAARNPAVSISTPHLALDSYSKNFELALNDLIRDIDLATTLREAAKDFLFMCGAVKVGRGEDWDGSLTTYCRAIQYHDIVYDMSSCSIRDSEFVGNYYREDYDAVMDSDLFDPEAKGFLSPTPLSGTIERGGESGDRHIRELELGGSFDAEELGDKIELVDLFLPRDMLFITMPVGMPLVLRAFYWEGPRKAWPYHFLMGERVPGQVNGMPATMPIIDLHHIANQNLTKLADQAERQKQVLGFAGIAETDARAIQGAMDGSIIRMNSPDNVREFSFGGADPGTLNFFLQVKDMFSWASGNLDALGGLGPQSGTLGQDEMLQQTSSKKVSALQEDFFNFTTDIVKHLAWYEWTDDVRVRQLTRTIPGTDIKIPVVWAPETRQGAFLDYDISIEPYSMQMKTPTERANQIDYIMQQYVLPMIPYLEQQGIVVDFGALLKTIARLRGIDELNHILLYGAGPMGVDDPGIVGSQPSAGGAPKPAMTTRRYERVSRPGKTRQGADRAMMDILMGAGNAQEAKSIIQ